MMIRNFLLIACGLLTSFNVLSETSPEANQAQQSLQSLLNKVKADGLKETQEHKVREAEFLKDKNQQAQLLKDAKSLLVSTKKETELLKKAFDKNELDIAKYEESLRLRMGNLGEMFGVVRQVSQDVASIRANSILAMELGAKSEVLDKLSNSRALPSIPELESLWVDIQTQMTAQAQIEQMQQKYIDESGVSQTGDITRVGPFIAFHSQGYLQYDAESQQLIQLSRQPPEALHIVDYLQSNAPFATLGFDPTRGAMLGLTTQSPDIMERIEQGGVIGYVIITLAIVGILFALIRLVQMISINSKVSAQLKNPESPNTNNPLGRVLTVYKQDTDADMDIVEMKLDEAVLKEVPSLERGQTLIKLLASVAPLLGLLGTVTGMIATFQSITLFGTGDAKLMSDGISQALMTTVLGLVAAIPLLFLHNLVSSRSRHLIQILDQQSAGLIAELAEKKE